MTELEKALAALSDGHEAPAFLKAGFQGFSGSGKTYTALLLACAMKVKFNLPGPIAMFDTEGGAPYLKPLVKKLTGSDLLALSARSFGQLAKWVDDCVAAGVSVAVADSITHPWRELCDTYLDRLNAARKRARKPKMERLEFQHWQTVKREWAEKWTDKYLNSPLNLIICGRAGYEYDFIENDSGKKELQKTGVKMKTENEFGYEPSLLVEMTRERDMTAETPTVVREATIIKERFGVIDGATRAFRKRSQVEEMDAVWEFFRPHLELLDPSSGATVDASTRTEIEVDEEGRAERDRQKLRREILLEKIQGELTRAWPGATKDEKAAKARAVESIFGTTSWREVEVSKLEELEKGLDAMVVYVRDKMKKENA